MLMFKKLLAYLPFAFLLYYAGDLASKILNTGLFEPDNSRVRWWVGMRLAEFYQWAMRKSLALDEWCGVWKEPSE